MKQNILVVGGAGFIGSNLVETLCGRDNTSVCVVDDLSLGRKSNLGKALATGKMQFVEDDISDTQACNRILTIHGPFDAVFHMAANSDIAKSAADPTIEFRKTFMTTYSLLETMRRHGTKELVFCSTSAIYGDRAGAAIDERSGPFLPISYYGGAKLACEGFISAYANMNGMRAVMLRFPNVVGDHATHGVIFDFVKRLKADPSRLEVLGDGKQEKPYLYVKDLVDAILFVRQNAPEAVAVYNVGVESRSTVSRIAEIVIQEMGLKGVRLSYTGGAVGWKGDVPRFAYDLSKIHALGWKATTSSDEAVRLSVRAILRELPK